MNVQAFIPFTPFLAVIFLFFALIQAIRHKQQGGGTAFLALLAIGVPVAAYILINDANVQVELIQFMALNAIIVFVGSIVILLIERGNPARDMNHSYGMLGVGLAILLALGIFLTPMLAKASNAISGNTTNGAGTTQTTGQGNPQVIQALTQQTGLTVADLTTQMNSGSTTIAKLVSAHNGNLTAVTSAITTALDQMTSSGSQSAQLLSRLGSSSDIATQLVQGQLQSRVQTLMVNLLLTGSTGFSGAGSFGGNGSGGNGNGGNNTTGGNGGFGGNGGSNAQTTQEAAPNNGSGGNGGSFGGFGGNPNATPSGNGGFGGFGGNPNATPGAPNDNGSGGSFGGFGGNPNATQPAPANNTSEQSIAPTNTPENQSVAQVPTQAATQGTETEVAQVLSQQTGLSVADLTTQLNNGSTLAQLVSAHNGDATAVSTAITNALDKFASSNPQGSQLLSRLGNSSSDIAGEVIQGQLPGRSQQIVMAVLLTGSLPAFGGSGGFGGNNTSGGNSGSGGNGGANQVPPTPTPTLAPPTATVMRPTRIVFPTDTPTPEGTEAATAEATAEAGGASVSSGTGTCTLVTTFNLNLRDKPNKDTGVVLLSVPANTSLTPTSKTSDGWYAVSYGGHDGWVDGQYTTTKGACSSLPTATATSGS
ncbi:MAG TPA: SH3 domain-containing protein [Phototrophicaceae bacterium]|nr:SH3 domain-containing protein [Phototrophicaceae bacterium]